MTVMTKSFPQDNWGPRRVKVIKNWKIELRKIELSPKYSQDVIIRVIFHILPSSVLSWHFGEEKKMNLKKRIDIRTGMTTVTVVYVTYVMSDGVSSYLCPSGSGRMTTGGYGPPIPIRPPPIPIRSVNVRLPLFVIGWLKLAMILLWVVIVWEKSMLSRVSIVKETNTTTLLHEEYRNRMVSVTSIWCPLRASWNLRGTQRSCRDTPN